MRCSPHGRSLQYVLQASRRQPYINPIIAVFLGWLFFREHFGMLEVIAMLIIFAFVAPGKRYSQRAISTWYLKYVDKLRRVDQNLLAHEGS